MHAVWKRTVYPTLTLTLRWRNANLERKSNSQNVLRTWAYQIKCSGRLKLLCDQNWKQFFWIFDLALIISITRNGSFFDIFLFKQQKQITIQEKTLKLISSFLYSPLLLYSMVLVIMVYVVFTINLNDWRAWMVMAMIRFDYFFNFFIDICHLRRRGFNGLSLSKEFHFHVLFLNLMQSFSFSFE